MIRKVKKDGSYQRAHKVEFSKFYNGRHETPHRLEFLLLYMIEQRGLLTFDINRAITRQ